MWLFLHQHKRLFEIIIVILSAIAFAYLTFNRANRLDKILFEYGNEYGGNFIVRTSDIWFDGDLPKMKYMMLQRTFAGHAITSEHPFLSTLLFFPTYILQNVFKISPWNAISVYSTSIAFIFTILLYVTIRYISGRMLDSILFTILGSSSAAATFWLPVPEAFSIGALSILLVLIISNRSRLKKYPLITHLFINLISLSVTVTNWVMGILSSILHLNWRRAILIIATAFVLASILWVVEKQAFPEAQFFLTGSSRTSEFLIKPSFTRVIEVTRTVFFHSMIMPEIVIQNKLGNTDYLSVQKSPLMYETVSGFGALILWMILLSGGIFGAYYYYKSQKEGFLLLAGSFLFMLGMHIFMGEEIFLYAMHFLPFLIILSSLSTLTRYRRFFLALTSILLVVLIINNIGQFQIANEIVDNMAEVARKLNFPE